MPLYEHEPRNKGTWTPQYKVKPRTRKPTQKKLMDFLEDSRKVEAIEKFVARHPVVAKTSSGDLSQSIGNGVGANNNSNNNNADGGGNNKSKSGEHSGRNGADGGPSQPGESRATSRASSWGRDTSRPPSAVSSMGTLTRPTTAEAPPQGSDVVLKSLSAEVIAKAPPGPIVPQDNNKGNGSSASIATSDAPPQGGEPAAAAAAASNNDDGGDVLDGEAVPNNATGAGLLDDDDDNDEHENVSLAHVKGLQNQRRRASISGPLPKRTAASAVAARNRPTSAASSPALPPVHEYHDDNGDEPFHSLPLHASPFPSSTPPRAPPRSGTSMSVRSEVKKTGIELVGEAVETLKLVLDAVTWVDEDRDVINAAINVLHSKSSSKKGSMTETRDYKSWHKRRQSLSAVRVLSRISTPSKEGTRLTGYNQLDSIASFVPRYLQERILKRFNEGHAGHVEPSVMPLRGAVMFADASGFTALTEKLAQQDNGAELLCSCLDEFFGKLIDIIMACGGDIIKFAGDAVLVLFEEKDNDPDWTAIEVCRTAVHCAMTALSDLHKYKPKNGGGVLLSLHIGIGYGDMFAVEVGGKPVKDVPNWEFLIEGPPMDQMAIAEPLASSGELCVSPEVWPYICDCVKKAVPVRHEDHAGKGFVKIKQFVDPGRGDRDRTCKARIHEKVRDNLLSYVPAAVRDRLNSSQRIDISEMRQVTVMFIKIIGAESNGEMPDVEQRQTMITTVQSSIYYYEGTLNKVLVDDKGLLALAIFGLPPFPHPDDALRALKSAKMVSSSLQEIGLKCSIGVTTGRVFCGTVGNATRGEYTVMGDTVNLAARLMQEASRRMDEQEEKERRHRRKHRKKKVTNKKREDFSILCDGPTHHATRISWKLSQLGQIKVKGKEELISISKPDYLKIKTTHVMPFVGRLQEKATLRLMVHNSITSGGCIMLRGVKGIGKSRLLRELEKGLHAIDDVKKVHLGSAQRSTVSLEPGREYREQHYSAWRNILKNLLAIGDEKRYEQIKWQVQSFLPDDKQDLCPLLNDVFYPTMHIPESNKTANMSRLERNRSTLDILVYILSHVPRPCAYLLDTADAMDQFSWTLAYRLANVPEIIVVLACQPFPSKAPVEYRDIVSRGDFYTLDLEPLPRSSIETIMKQYWNVTEIPEDVVFKVANKSEGIPYYAEELAQYMKDEGLVTFHRGYTGEIVLPSEKFAEADLPDTVEPDVLRMMDEFMSTKLQTLIKIASVMPPIFSADMLNWIYQQKYADSQSSKKSTNIRMEDIMEPLVAQLRLLAIVDQRTRSMKKSKAGDKYLFYQFRSRLAKNAIANTMLSSQKEGIKETAQKYQRNWNVPAPKEAQPEQQAKERQIEMEDRIVSLSRSLVLSRSRLNLDDEVAAPMRTPAGGGVGVLGDAGIEMLDPGHVRDMDDGDDLADDGDMGIGRGGLPRIQRARYRGGEFQGLEEASAFPTNSPGVFTGTPRKGVPSFAITPHAHMKWHEASNTPVHPVFPYRPRGTARTAVHPQHLHGVAAGVLEHDPADSPRTRRNKKSKNARGGTTGGAGKQRKEKTRELSPVSALIEDVIARHTECGDRESNNANNNNASPSKK